MPSSAEAKYVILKLLETEIPKNFNGDILELGSGFLTLALPLAKKFPKNSVLAFETSMVPYLISIIRNYFYNSNLTVLNKDFFKADFQSACLIVCYLYPKAMEKLKVKFEQELKDGTFIVSNTFAIPGWKPLQVLTLDDIYHTKIYLYQMGQ
jgi:16S rRNA A1518/A1519 N6-dimethyltransferase RsmA/KsgA/DIM1 with predicted DNA glycosylase/AP lyase activity